MKKTLIVITLALLALASIFAADATSPSSTLPASTSTQVTLKLDKTPKYIFGITKGALTKVEEKDPSTTSITNEENIALTRTALTFKDSVDNYYLTFLLYEYEAVDVTLTLDGNLRHPSYDTVSEAEKPDYEVAYTLKVSEGSDKNQAGNSLKSFEEKTLKSNSSTENVWKVAYDAPTSKLGEYNWASLKLTFASTSDTALNGKATGSFSNTVTVRIASHS